LLRTFFGLLKIESLCGILVLHRILKPLILDTMGLTIEECYVKHIECGTRAIKLGAKDPSEANVGKYLNKLKPINDGLYEDLMERYKKVLNEYNKRIK